MKISLVLAFSIVLPTSSAVANAYDDCILHFVASAQNQNAVFAIERACISKTSVQVPDTYRLTLNEGSGASFGSYNIGMGTLERGLLIHINNTTPYDITEASVNIENKATKAVRYYAVINFTTVLTQGAILAGMPDPAFSKVIKSRQTAEFFVKIEETTSDTGNFAKFYQWGIMPVKGIPAD